MKETEKKILNRAKEYYKNNKEVLTEQGRNKYRGLSEGEKEIKRKYGNMEIDMKICLKKKNKD